MPEGASKYPIVQFLDRLMNEYCFCKIELVKALGYRHNSEKGLRRLDLWLENGEGHGKILEEIATVFPAYADGLERAVAATNAMKAGQADALFLERCKAQQETFEPYIHAEGETTVPNGICIFAFTGGHDFWTSIRIPKAVLGLPIEDQLAKVPKLMRAYRKRYNSQCPFFGKLTGFKFVRLLDYYQFDSDGRFLQHVAKPFRHGECFVELR